MDDISEQNSKRSRGRRSQRSSAVTRLKTAQQPSPSDETGVQTTDCETEAPQRFSKIPKSPRDPKWQLTDDLHRSYLAKANLASDAVSSDHLLFKARELPVQSGQDNFHRKAKIDADQVEDPPEAEQAVEEEVQDAPSDEAQGQRTPRHIRKKARRKATRKQRSAAAKAEKRKPQRKSGERLQRPGTGQTTGAELRS
ncbi:MAG: hypothetical protein M1828_002967 [Chrysothrix sp. TS-e1954]|nr:MAG: hypothetical protein M1828_002967 [Chrysothrix sp. TS-e1954]